MSFIFNADETPQQREERKNKAVADALFQTATQTPQSVGQGMAAMGNAFAYRQMQERQKAAAADPWNGMRQVTPSGPFGQISLGLAGLFGR